MKTLEAKALILAVAMEMASNEAEAQRWYEEQPIPGWGGKTAQSLVHEGKADKVLEYLESLRAGVYA